MKKLTSILLATLAIAFALTLTGCATDPEESTIPWSRPQSWEGGVPGMGIN